MANTVLGGQMRNVVGTNPDEAIAMADEIMSRLRDPERQRSRHAGAGDGAESMIAVTLNGRGLLPKDLKARRAALEKSLDLPVVLPLEGGMKRLVTCVREWLGRVK